MIPYLLSLMIFLLVFTYGSVSLKSAGSSYYIPQQNITFSAHLPSTFTSTSPSSTSECCGIIHALKLLFSVNCSNNLIVPISWSYLPYTQSNLFTHSIFFFVLIIKTLIFLLSISL